MAAPNNEMLWAREYPSLATAMSASFETVSAWCELLPKPQTDVERTIYKRLHVRREALARSEIKDNHPDIASAMNRIIDLMERAGIKSPVDRY